MVIHRLLNLSDNIKLLMSLTLVALGIMYHFDRVPAAWNAEQATHEVKAALLAVSTAFAMILSLLPSGRHRIIAVVSTYAAHLSAAGLAFAAGYNWLYSATEGNIVPYIWYPSLLFVGALIGITIGFANSVIATRGRKQPQMNEMEREFRRFEESAKHESTHNAEMIGHASIAELLIAMLLHFHIHRPDDRMSPDTLNELVEHLSDLDLSSPAYVGTLKRIKTLTNRFGEPTPE